MGRHSESAAAATIVGNATYERALQTAAHDKLDMSMFIEPAGKMACEVMFLTVLSELTELATEEADMPAQAGWR